MTDEYRSPKVNPWHPISNKTDLKILGKLLEELGELTAAASRCVIQGQNSCEPVTGKKNIEWLQDEIADVLAGIEITTDRFFLDRSEIRTRVERKKEHLRSWHLMP
jgi:NTP pyrophosphatase (non-canonical NTP hydrolase)